MASSASAAAFLADGFGDTSLRAGEVDGGRDLVGVFVRGVMSSREKCGIHIRDASLQFC